MENAGTAVARLCLRRYAAAERVLVLCGKGNNGGDGFVAARVLAEAGVDVAVLLLGREDEVKGEADHPSEQTRRGPRATALARLRAQAPSVAIWPVTDEAALAAASGAIASAELLIDAVVGTGFKPPLRGLPAALRELVANSAAPVVAVDLPSGWDADSLEQAAQDAFRADAVVTFTRPEAGARLWSLDALDVWPGRGCGDWITRRGDRLDQRIELGRRSEGNRRSSRAR